ncbi:MAG: DUF4332 domain-containing protein [Thermoplasmatota archaeon]
MPANAGVTESVKLGARTAAPVTINPDFERPVELLEQHGNVRRTVFRGGMSRAATPLFEVATRAPMVQMRPRPIATQPLTPWSPPAAPILVEVSKEEPIHRKRRARAKPVPRETKARRKEGYVDYAGDNHEVIDIEGIGPKYAKRLQKAGVYTTHRLAYERAGRLARAIRVPKKRVRTWQAEAQLIKVKGIGKQYAEALARAGVRDIDSLKEEKPEAIARTVTNYLESLETHVLGTSITPRRVKGWQKAARTMKKHHLPIPAKGPPDFETVRGHIRKMKAT